MARPKTLSKNGFGENGKSVHIVTKTEEEKELRAKIIEKYGVDHFVSDRISVHRTVGEHRLGCLIINLGLLSSLNTLG